MSDQTDVDPEHTDAAADVPGDEPSDDEPMTPDAPQVPEDVNVSDEGVELTEEGP